MYNTQNELIDDITSVLHDYPVKRAAFSAATQEMSNALIRMLTY